MTTATAATATYEATVEYLRDAIEHAPLKSGPIAPGLLGWWTPDGAYICSTCSGRIIARGCKLPRGSEACWTGQPYGVCCTCADTNGEVLVRSRS